MAELRVPLECHGHRSRPAAIVVTEQGDGYVDVEVEPEEDGQPLTRRSLTAGEARALAACLVHFAEQVDR